MDWNDKNHLQRVEADNYRRQLTEIFAPKIIEAIEAGGCFDKKGVIHDVGGYDGYLLKYLLEHHLKGWKGIVTDGVTPLHQIKHPRMKFEEIGAQDYSKKVTLSTDITLCVNTVHLLSDEELTAFGKNASEVNAKNGLCIVIFPHPVTHRQQWSDFAGMNTPVMQKTRGVWLESFVDRITDHAFLENTTTYVRTTESFISCMLSAGLRLRGLENIHLTAETAIPGREKRFYEALELLPTYQLSVWRT